MLNPFQHVWKFVSSYIFLHFEAQGITKVLLQFLGSNYIISHATLSFQPPKYKKINKLYWVVPCDKVYKKKNLHIKKII